MEFRGPEALLNFHGGHGGSSGRFDRIRESDRNYAFMLTELGIME